MTRLPTFILDGNVVAGRPLLLLNSLVGGSSHWSATYVPPDHFLLSLWCQYRSKRPLALVAGRALGIGVNELGPGNSRSSSRSGMAVPIGGRLS
jgi:hypothetical protein